MKEAQIRKKATEIWTKQNWIWWFPAKVRYKKEIDIFGIWDAILLKKDKINFIQLTTISNIRAREKKIKEFLKKNNLSIYSEVWGWNEKKKEFKILIIY